MSNPYPTSSGGFFVKEDTLSNLHLYQMFVREVGKALEDLTKPTHGKGSFKAENGVKFEFDFNVCVEPECKEVADDGEQPKVTR